MRGFDLHKGIQQGKERDDEEEYLINALIIIAVHIQVAAIGPYHQQDEGQGEEKREIFLSVGKGHARQR